MGLEIPNRAVTKPPLVRPHGIPPRGIDMDTRSRLFEGRFGRIFRALAPADFGATDTETEQLLETLAAAMIHEVDCPKVVRTTRKAASHQPTRTSGSSSTTTSRSTRAAA